SWIALPMPRPEFRGAPEVLPRSRATELATAHGLSLLPAEPRPGVAPFGVVVLERPDEKTALGIGCDVVAWAGPILARLSELAEAKKHDRSLAEERDRLTLMIDSLPDPVIVTNAANEIVALNGRASRILRPRNDDSVGRRRALELNNLLFSSFL